MEQKKFGLTSFHLHILAMALMLSDHLWTTIVPGNDWMTDIGRLAFPIFAFMNAEGFRRTKNLRKYAGRLFLFALISEIPYDLAFSGTVFYPLHQNVLWTFLISVGLMWLNEKVKEKKIFIRILVGAGTVILGFALGILTMCDYYHAGIFMVLTFYFLHERKLWCFIAQAICLWYINFEIISGYEYVYNIFGNEVYFLRQGYAMLALIPIWLYKGEQGLYNKGVKALYYWFYPAHLLILWFAESFVF